LDKFEMRLNKRETSHRKWNFVKADLNHYFPLASNSVDTVLANQVIEHILDPYHIVSEIYRILKPEGVAVITTPNIRYVKNLWRIVINGLGPKTAGVNVIDGVWDDGHLHYFTHKDLHEIFLKVGFHKVLSKGLVNIEGGGFVRRITSRYSATKSVREFLSGNILLVATKWQ
jgi:ubiquinone/menaquinone biosynthesis C-methylase UbiE